MGNWISRRLNNPSPPTSPLDDGIFLDDDAYFNTVYHPIHHDYAEVTNQTSTSLTLKSCPVSNLSYCFKKANRVQPGVKELSLIGVSFPQPYPVSVETKNETLEILKITAGQGNVHHVLHEVAENCPALTKLDVAFDVEDYPIEVTHRRSSTWPICHSLRVLELTVGQLTLKDLISVMDVVSALYPNIQHLTINVKNQYESDEKSIIGSVSLQLHHLEDLTFSSTGMDPKAEKDLKLTLNVFCPQLAPAASQDGVYFFRRMYGVSGYLDHLGGELSIPAHNVKLSIPPEALEYSEKISIEVFTDLPNGINLQDNEIAASFGFRCFPSGSSFKKPLTLSMPHCAVINDNKAVGMVLHFGSNEEGKIRRIPLDSNRYVIHADMIELQIDHFSWGILTMVYNWLFPATKRMLCTPFVPETLPENQDSPTLRVRFYDQLPGLSEKILAEEESLKYKKIYPEEELIVKNGSIDMSISCHSKELSSTQTKVITAKELMQHAKLSVCMTLLQRSSLVTLIITQEREITMTFSTDIKDEKSLLHPSISEASPSVGEVEGMITPMQSLPLKAAPPTSPHTGDTREELPGALVPYVPTQEIESTQQRAFRYQRRLEDHRSLDPDCLTDEQLVDISSKLPLDKFNPISIKLGSTMTETENIRSSSNKAEEIYFTVLTRWKERTGAPKRQLIDVLRSVKLLGIVQSMGLVHDSSQEDVESIC